MDPQQNKDLADKLAAANRKMSDMQDRLNAISDMLNLAGVDFGSEDIVSRVRSVILHRQYERSLKE